jgi:hypothetical protein
MPALKILYDIQFQGVKPLAIERFDPPEIAALIGTYGSGSGIDLALIPEQLNSSPIHQFPKNRGNVPFPRVID